MNSRPQTDALDKVMDAVITVDNEHNITYLNNASAKQYGVDVNTAIGSKITPMT
jgi:PAS domain-containing protein